MVNILSKVGIVGVVLSGVFYQLILKSLIFDILGYGREIASINTFSNYKCEKIDELGLEGCEDMWLHQPTGHLYMACSDTQSRTQWLPATDFLNAPGRGLTDRIAVLDTRGSGRLASRIKWLSIENFSGINGDGTLNLHGFDVLEEPGSDNLRILLVNHRPPIDPVTGNYLDATVLGANSTIEEFITKLGAESMQHVKTYANSIIQTPNRVTWVDREQFLFTNDHSGKVGLRREFDPLLGGGNVGYCNQDGCHAAYGGRFDMSNGLTKGHDGLIYVPNTISTKMDVFALTEKKILEKVVVIEVGLPIDNLSVDKNGDIYAAAFPRVYEWVKHSKAPFKIDPPSTVLRIRRLGKGFEGTGTEGELKRDGGYIVDTVLEDNGSVLPASTVAVHDSETGRIFLGGCLSPFITICQVSP